MKTFKEWLIEYTEKMRGQRAVAGRDMEAAWNGGQENALTFDPSIAAQPKMFLCDSLKGHWPVGGEAIVIAYDIDEAVTLLQRQVELEGLPKQTVVAEQLVEVDCATPRAVIINDGNY